MIRRNEEWDCLVHAANGVVLVAQEQASLRYQIEVGREVTAKNASLLVALRGGPHVARGSTRAPGPPDDRLRRSSSGVVFP
jgi:hypothetical protein